METEIEGNIKKVYQGEKGKEYHDSVNGVTSDVYRLISLLRAKKFQPFIKDTDVVFEYGVGTGWNLEHIIASKKIGFDVATHMEKELTEKGISFLSDMGKVEDVSADVVICHHVLEHIVTPDKTLAELSRVVTKEGLVILCVPFEQERKYKTFDKNEPNHHLFSWNPQTLGNLVTMSGFEIVQYGAPRFGYDRFAANLANKFGGSFFLYTLIRNMLLFIYPHRELFFVLKKA